MHIKYNFIYDRAELWDQCLAPWKRDKVRLTRANTQYNSLSLSSLDTFTVKKITQNANACSTQVVKFRFFTKEVWANAKSARNSSLHGHIRQGTNPLPRLLPVGQTRAIEQYSPESLVNS